MTSRLDRLLVLLDTGSSSSVRQTAAKQLAELAAKSVAGDVQIEEDVKNVRSEVPRADVAAWTELMSVVARILPFLHSKSHETRTAASTTLSNICSLVPVWRPVLSHDVKSKSDPDVKMEDASKVAQPLRHPPEFPQFSVQELLQKGTLLLSSSGKEFVKPANLLANPAEVKKARKAAMSRLGLDFLDAVGDDDDGMDWEKELADDADVDAALAPMADVKVEHDNSLAVPVPILAGSLKSVSARATSISIPSSSSTPSLPPDTPAEEDLAGMSARERNRLKRKRKGGGSAFVAAPPPTSNPNSKYSATSNATGSKVRLVDRTDSSPPASRSTSPPTADGDKPSDKVIVDPTKGGAVNPKAAEQSKALQVQLGAWPWEGLVKILQVDLYSPAWEARHGAAMALRDILRSQGHCGGMKDDTTTEDNDFTHERWCNELASQILCIFVLDRFGDFVSDQVVAPVRETVSQTLASLLIHMPRRSVYNTHSVLLQMVRQDFPIPSSTTATLAARSSRRAGTTNKRAKEPTHIWEVRHAGLLGIKYEVAVRPDLVSEPVKDDSGLVSQAALQDVVDAAILGLGDRDDDVRSVAASCLLPVAKHVVELLPHALPQVLAVLWSGLTDMKDDLSSSVGTVMDLLGVLVAHDTVIEILADEKRSSSINVLAPTLYPFFRHTIPNVRLAVVRTLQSFMVVPSLSKEWVHVPFLCLLFQNLAIEEQTDIREATLTAWKMALQTLGHDIHEVISQELVLQWYEISMTPLGTPINTTTFYTPAASMDGEKHNVDKHMVLQDLALVSMESIFKARIAASTGLAQLLVYWPEDMQAFDELFRPFLTHYINSASMLQKFLTAVVIEEWARGHDTTHPTVLLEVSPLARDLSVQLLLWLQSDTPIAYHEMVFLLSRLHVDCYNLLHGFVTECRIAAACIPNLGTEIDPTGENSACFTIHTAREAVGTMFDELKNMLGRTKKKEVAGLVERRNAVAASIERFFDTKSEYDIRVSASFAAAYIALKATPEKVSPIVKGIMNGVKSEENLDIQTRSATAVSNFVGFCAQYNLSQPPEKIVKNLCTFLCQDTERTPTFSSTHTQHAGILSFTALSKVSASNGRGASEKQETPPEESKTRLSGRGAALAFNQLSTLFGAHLLDIIPGMWQSMVGGLLSACSTDSATAADDLMAQKFGQDVIDSLSVLEAVVPALHENLWPKVLELLPKLLLALRSKYAIVRRSAARCLATVCDVVTTGGMRFVIENVIPLLADPLSLPNRQGGAELIYHIVQKLDIKALAYVLFMIVPVLGRMSDPDDDVRATSTNTFASLVKMVPLEAGLPDPPGFSEEMLARRETERQFLTQLLDGKKVEQYQLPIPVNAELRTYQQEGVNWLAFLAKYQLHGILCDDMGLGKTLQSICILSGKHYERAQKHKESQSPDAVHLPSLIVCPPTLTGHWYHEVQKYSENLRPMLYVGNSRDRARLLPKLKQFDVVITSYEVVRNDIANLEKVFWHYCILDEGHIIKNAKTKLTKAVKQVRANHRLILSGTPIQNNVLELWSLFDFLMPGFLGTEQSFNDRFSKPILANRDGKSKNPEAAALALEALHKQVLPFLLRRLKEDVLHDLPPKIIQDYYCELSDLQKQMYDDFASSQAGHAVQSEVASTDGESAPKGQGHVFQSLQYLRKLVNHPALVLKDDKEATRKALAKAGISGPPNLNDIQHAPKLLALRQLLQDCGIGLGATSPTDGKAKNDDVADMTAPAPAFAQHRALIFCQMKQMLDIIEHDLFKAQMSGVTYMRLDGGTDASRRHSIVQTFNADPSIDVLLLTTHVGGLGLTLTGADTVIFVEHDWNPMKDMQAMDRAHRIGQKKVVNVYRLITKGTLEEKIMGLQRFKLNIANSVITQQNAGLASMDTDLVLDLFKRTTEEEDAAAAKKKKAKEASGPISQKNVLQGLEDLPPEEEYQGLDLSSFMSSLGR